MSVNKVILIGRLGKDPEIKYTQSGSAVASFTLATDRSWKDSDGQKQSETTWHTIVVWGKRAEVVNDYLKKGQQVYIEGRIANRSYDDKDGNKKYVSEIVLSDFAFLGKKDDEDRTTRPNKDDDDDLPF